ncbi:MAG: 4-hydroxy-tetrahydrodipicolinate reductase [Hymenobacteraceae bacterium]|nr:4-hydroxy-tetrahydrodipicolinate reductase [Hymenobacteraceae bacterium]
MNLLLIGYGRMGRTHAERAPRHGAHVTGIADPAHGRPLAELDLAAYDVAIEFTRPEAAFDNIATCLRAGLPVVSGSTGWLARFEEARALAETTGGALFYASNYSVGVNLFFHFTGLLAQEMARWNEYHPVLTEIHHLHKLDSPSGTALTTAAAVLRHAPGLSGWQEVAPGAEASVPADKLPLVARREGEVIGAHDITWHSPLDELALRHVAHSRAGFANGALRAAQWLIGRKGTFGMAEMLGL